MFIADPSFAYKLVIDRSGSKLYWPNFEGIKIARINIDGNGRETVVNPAGAGPISFALDKTNNSIFWFDDGSTQIYKSDINNAST